MFDDAERKRILAEARRNVERRFDEPRQENPDDIIRKSATNIFRLQSSEPQKRWNAEAEAFERASAQARDEMRAQYERDRESARAAQTSPPVNWNAFVDEASLKRAIDANYDFTTQVVSGALGRAWKAERERADKAIDAATRDLRRELMSLKTELTAHRGASDKTEGAVATQLDLLARMFGSFETRLAALAREIDDMKK